MKQLFVLGLVLFSVCANAQNEKYTKAMQQNIAMLDSAVVKGPDALNALSDNFTRIGDAEKTQWLPYYYASYATVMSAYLVEDKSKSDGIADKAEGLLKKAEGIAGKENSETCVIKSMIASAHMMVDPQTRWQQYGEGAMTNIAKAKSLDANNPRPVFLEGQAKFFTPESFGGGKAPAKELLTKALSMYTTFKPETNLHPSWGEMSTKYYLSQCN